MKQCWEEKPQSRPTFSSLVVSVGNMLTDDYKKVSEFTIFESWMSSKASCNRFMSCFYVSVITIWLRTSWKVNNQRSFDPELLEIKIKRQTQTVGSQKKHAMSPTHQDVNYRYGTDTLCCLQNSEFLRWMFTALRRRRWTGARQDLPLVLTSSQLMTSPSRPTLSLRWTQAGMDRFP